MVQFKLHEDARAALSQRADQLKLKLTLRPEKDNLPRSTDPDIFVAHRFEEQDIHNLEVYGTDTDGEPINRIFSVGGREIGFFGEEYSELRGLAASFGKSVQPNGVVSNDLIEKLLFDWIKLQYNGETDIDASAFILQNCPNHISDAEIWIPISHLRIENEFQVGDVIFKKITKSMMDREEEQIIKAIQERGIENESEAIDGVKRALNRRRGDIQGLAAATFQMEAEDTVAYEIAQAKTETAVALLRFFSPYNFSPTHICYIAPIDKQHLDADNFMRVKDGAIVSDFTGVSDPRIKEWRLGAREIQVLEKSGLGMINELLANKNFTTLQSKVLAAMELYSHACLAKNAGLRLVIILAATESVFLRDSNEAIGENVGLRMAQMLFQDLGERRKTMENFRDVYKIRSQYIHHGNPVEQKHNDLLAPFMRNTWNAILNTLDFSKRGDDRDAFFRYLDDRKIRG